MEGKRINKRQSNFFYEKFNSFFDGLKPVGRLKTPNPFQSWVMLKKAFSAIFLVYLHDYPKINIFF